MLTPEVLSAFYYEMEKIALTAEKKALRAKGLGLEVTEGSWRKAGVLAQKGKLKREDLAHPSPTFVERAKAVAPREIEHAEVWTPGGARHQVPGQKHSLELPMRNRHDLRGYLSRTELTAHDIRPSAAAARERMSTEFYKERKADLAASAQARAQILASEGEDAARAYTKRQSDLYRKASKEKPYTLRKQSIHSHPYTTHDRATLLPELQQSAATQGWFTRFPGTILSEADANVFTGPGHANKFQGVYDPVNNAVSHYKGRLTGGKMRGMRLLSKVV